MNYRIETQSLKQVLGIEYLHFEISGITLYTVAKSADHWLIENYPFLLYSNLKTCSFILSHSEVH